MILLNGAKTTSFMPREGMIIQWPLKGQFHDVVIVIIMPQMVVSKKFLTVAVIENVGTFVIFLCNHGQIVNINIFGYFPGNISDIFPYWLIFQFLDKPRAFTGRMYCQTNYTPPRVQILDFRRSD